MTRRHGRFYRIAQCRLSGLINGLGPGGHSGWPGPGGGGGGPHGSIVQPWGEGGRRVGGTPAPGHRASCPGDEEGGRGGWVGILVKVVIMKGGGDENSPVGYLSVAIS